MTYPDPLQSFLSAVERETEAVMSYYIPDEETEAEEA